MSHERPGQGQAAGGAERRRRYPLAKVKGCWTSEEDQLLKQLVEELGEGNWSVIARRLNNQLGKTVENGRIGKQCRERFNHHLQEGIRKDAWTEEEEELLVQAHMKYGNRWSDIAKVIRGRTENAVKNHWNATLRRKDGERVASKAAVPAHQSCVLKTYMVSISLLPPSAVPSMYSVLAGAATGAAQAGPATSSSSGAQLSCHGLAAKQPAPQQQLQRQPRPALAGKRRSSVVASVAEPTPQDSHSAPFRPVREDEEHAHAADSPCSSVNTEAHSYLGQGGGVSSGAGEGLTSGVAAGAASAPVRKRPRIIVIPSVRPSPGALALRRSAAAASIVPAAAAGMTAGVSAATAAAKRLEAKRAAAAAGQAHAHHGHQSGSDSADESHYLGPSEPQGFAQPRSPLLAAAPATEQSDSDVQAAQIMMALKSVLGPA